MLSVLTQRSPLLAKIRILGAVGVRAAHSHGGHGTSGALNALHAGTCGSQSTSMQGRLPGTCSSNHAVPYYTQPVYYDHRTLPLPEVPYRETLSSQETALKEKEKGPWKQLSLEDKISLYHMKFNHTYADMNKPSNEWKTVLGAVFFFFGVTGLIVWWQKLHVFPPIPHTLQDDWKAMQVRRMLDMHVGPIEGFSSKWDYEKNEWKK